jgi:hypothetical protein
MTLESINQAQAKLDTIVEAITALRELNDGAESVTVEGQKFDDAESLIDYICEMPLSVEVRSGWQRPGSELTPAEAQILLCTGGPAARVFCKLGQHGEPYDIRLDHQDWYEPWQPLILTTDEEDALSEFLQHCGIGAW